MNNFADMLKGLQGLQGSMEGMQEKMKGITANGESGAGMVKVVLRGDFSVESLVIDESLFFSGAAVVSDLVKAAMQEALKDLQKQIQESLFSSLPFADGFKFPPMG